MTLSNTTETHTSPICVYVLVISHRHGDNVTVHTTEEGAHGELAAYCDERWNSWEHPTTATKPEDNQELIDGYFETVSGDESYEIHFCGVNKG